MIQKYVDFELQISLDEQQVVLDVNGRPHGINLPEPIKIPMPFLPCNSTELLESSAHVLPDIGHLLYKSFFISDVGSRFQGYLNRRSQAEGVRVCIFSNSNIVNSAVWEILCNQLQPVINFLALDPRTPVVRVPRVGTEVYWREMRYPLRLLVVLASPRLVQKIDHKEEKQVLESALGEAQAKGNIQVDYVGFDDQTEANFDNLQGYLTQQELPYDIVHIIGHGLLEAGYEGKVALVKPDDQKRQNVTASSLANLFRSRGVMLVVLQSCQSGSVDPSSPRFSSLAQYLVASGVPAVLAMQECIEQDVARHFIKRFYEQWLGGGCQLEDALTQARHSIEQAFPNRTACWAIPVLYISPGVQLRVDRESESVQQEATVRELEAALPQRTRVGKRTELVILIRKPESPGLREVIGAHPLDFEVVPDDVRPPQPFEVSFPIDEKTERVKSKDLKIVIETDDFELDQIEWGIKIHPQVDSVLRTFELTPKEEGLARLTVNIVDEVGERREVLAQVRLGTRVLSGDAFEAEYQVMDARRAAQAHALMAAREIPESLAEKALASLSQAEERPEFVSSAFGAMARLISLYIGAQLERSGVLGLSLDEVGKFELEFHRASIYLIAPKDYQLQMLRRYPEAIEHLQRILFEQKMGIDAFVLTPSQIGFLRGLDWNLPFYRRATLIRDDEQLRSVLYVTMFTHYLETYLRSWHRPAEVSLSARFSREYDKSAIDAIRDETNSCTWRVQGPSRDYYGPTRQPVTFSGTCHLSLLSTELVVHLKLYVDTLDRYREKTEAAFDDWYDISLERIGTEFERALRLTEDFDESLDAISQLIYGIAGMGVHFREDGRLHYLTGVSGGYFDWRYVSDEITRMRGGSVIETDGWIKLHSRQYSLRIKIECLPT